MNALVDHRQFARNTDTATASDMRLRAFQQGRLLGLRSNRYSWWTHARELADFILPRRYKWLITQNQQSRGSPINQHILDSTGTLAARNLAAGIFSGVCPPTRPWIKYKYGRIDSTQSGPIPIWLKQCEELTYAVLAASGFYTSMAVFLFDLVVFGTAALLIYEDFDNVITCINPCFGEYYVDIDGKYRPVIFYREFTYTISQTVDEFGWENCSSMIQTAYDNASGAYLTREVIIAHAIEPNTDPEKYGIPAHFKYRETFWEWGGTTTPQGGTISKGFLRKRGFNDFVLLEMNQQPGGNARCIAVSTASKGAGIRTALDFLRPYAMNEKKWEYQEITPYNNKEFATLLFQAGYAYKEPQYMEYAKSLGGRQIPHFPY